LINQELENLYSKWRNPNVHFVDGGVIDQHMYESSEVKVLMLLKEVNDAEQKENWSLVDLIKAQIEKKKFLPIWQRVGEWSFGLEQGFPYYEKIYEYMGEENIAEGLSSIATTNLKKSGGTGESDYEVIKNHAITNKDLWTREIEIIQPDVVVCGGTFPIVQEILKFDCQKCRSGGYYGKALNATFIGFCHPQYRVSPKILYSYFKETMQSLGY
jgi:hypothetical protein